jgi:arginase
MKKLTVIGVPMWLGQSEFGTQLGPDAIRAAGLIQCLQSSDIDIIDIGNLDIQIRKPYCCMNDANCNIKNLEDIRDCVELLASKISEVVSSGRFPLILGGDHSISIGTLAGIAKHYRNLGVIWYDAHADCNTTETSPSGNIQGMPLAASIGAGHPDLIQVGGYKRKIKAENVVLIGVRDIDPGERAFIEEKQMKIFTSEDVHRMGIQNVIGEAVSHLSSQCDGIHLSCDLDVIDPRDGRGVGTPVECGIYLEQNIEAMKLLAEKNVITSAEFVEVNPLLDKDGRTVEATLALIRALFRGEDIR